MIYKVKRKVNGKSKEQSQYWYAAFYVKDANGKLIKRSISTKTTDEKKAREIEADLQKSAKELAENKRIEHFLTKTAAVVTSSTIKAVGMPLNLVWEKYSSDHTQINRTERTQRSKKQVWDRFVEWLNKNFGQVETINDVSRDIAKEYIKTIQDKKAATFNNNKNSLSSIWQVLTIQAGLKENVWRLFKGAEDDSIPYRPFSMNELKTIWTKSGIFWRVAVAVGFYTGLRFKDVVFLRKSQIQGDYMAITPAKTKRKGKDVRPFIHPTLKQILIDWITNNPNDLNDYLFPEQVELYDTPDFQRAFGKILTDCEIYDTSEGKVGFHSLRHTFVTFCEELGVDRKIVQGIVGCRR